MSRSFGFAAVDRRLYRVWLAGAPTWGGWSASLIIIGWVVFEATGSPALVSLAFVLRLAPLAFAGIPAGTVSDRLGRVETWAMANLVTAALLGVLIIAPHLPVAAILLLSAGLGVCDSLRMVAGPNLAFELSGDFNSTRAVAVSALVASVGQALGSLLTGPLLAAAGTAAAASVACAAFLIGALLLAGFRVDRSTTTPRPGLVRDIRDGASLVRRSSQVAILLAVAIVLELFGFSGIALDPVFAGAVFGAGPVGLGIIVASRSLGRIVGSAAIMAWGARIRVGVALAAAVLSFGLGMAVYAIAPSLAWAIPFALVIGVSGAFIDVLEQTALQDSVSPHERGRATGLWVLAIGLGPIGVILAGVLAEAAGARFTQGAFGIVVALSGVVLLTIFAPAMRRLSRVQVADIRER